MSTSYAAGTIKRVYTVVPGKLYAGPIPSSPNTDDITEIIKHLITEKGIRCFVNLMEQNEVNSAGQPFNEYESFAKSCDGGIEVVRFSIPDMSVPSKALMKTIINFIDNKIAEDKPVYIHCWGGLGRTGTIVGCWLRRHGEQKPVAKIFQLRRQTINANQESPQSRQQHEMIASWGVGE